MDQKTNCGLSVGISGGSYEIHAVGATYTMVNISNDVDGLAGTKRSSKDARCRLFLPVRQLDICFIPRTRGFIIELTPFRARRWRRTSG